MKDSRTEYEWIHDYLNDRLEQGDLAAFERRLMEDSRLLDATQMVIALRTGLREVQRPARSMPHGHVSGGASLSAIDHDSDLTARTPVWSRGQLS